MNRDFPQSSTPAHGVWHFGALAASKLGGWAVPALAVFAGLMLAACAAQPAPAPEEQPDDPLTGELQSDFLEVGSQAGVQWLSFLDRAADEYPEFYSALDDDRRRRRWVGPTGPGQVLFELNLPPGSKIRAVDWFGTTCVAIDLPDAKGYTMALAKLDTFKSASAEIGRKRAELLAPNASTASVMGSQGGTDVFLDGACRARYRVVPFAGRKDFVMVFEAVNLDARGKLQPLTKAQYDRWGEVTRCALITRDLAVEGSPNHACRSKPEDLARGRLVFERDTLQLPVAGGHSVRKLGTGSTIAVDGAGAQPLLLLRRLEETGAEGDLRVRVGTAPLVRAWLAPSSARFAPGVKLADSSLPVIWFDYSATGREHMALAVLDSGHDLYLIEVSLSSLREPAKRREAFDAARAFAARISYLEAARAADDRTDKLVGWRPE